VTGLWVKGRPGYGPADGELQVSQKGSSFQKVASFEITDGQAARIRFEETTGSAYRLLARRAYDRRFPQSPRNVQIAELQLFNEKLTWPATLRKHRPIRLLHIKTASREFGGSAPDCSQLLEDVPEIPGEEDYHSVGVVDITRAARPDKNKLEVDITNFWPNRIIGDSFLPHEERLTQHNTTKFTKKSPIPRSGLFGTVQIRTVRQTVFTFPK